jgi:5-(carboxyamino)imidazole ribonucleotide mutase
MSKAVIIMGSKADLDWAKRIEDNLNLFEVESSMHVASAHKVPLKCYDLIKKYEHERVVFITIAGMSNALSGFTDAQTHHPVIACPPYSDKFGGADIFSSVRMPSGVAPLTILSPENAALSTAKILGHNNEKIKANVIKYQENNRSKIEEADASIQKSL